MYSYLPLWSPAVFISFLVTGNVVPQLGFGATDAEGFIFCDKLMVYIKSLGFHEYTSGSKSMFDVFCITMALMVGTAGLPHVIVRFFTVKKVKDARKSAGWAPAVYCDFYILQHRLLLYSLEPTLLKAVSNKPYDQMPVLVLKKWETTGLLGFTDKNDDGYINIRQMQQPTNWMWMSILWYLPIQKLPIYPIGLLPY